MLVLVVYIYALLGLYIHRPLNKPFYIGRSSLLFPAAGRLDHVGINLLILASYVTAYILRTGI